MIKPPLLLAAPWLPQTYIALPTPDDVALNLKQLFEPVLKTKSVATSAHVADCNVVPETNGLLTQEVPQTIGVYAAVVAHAVAVLTHVVAQTTGEHIQVLARIVVPVIA